MIWTMPIMNWDIKKNPNRWIYKDKDQCSLNFLFNLHNVDLASLVELGTLKNYFSTHRFLQEFLIKSSKVKDICLDDVDNKLITDFSIYMRSRKPDKGQKPCGNNTLMKHIERFKKVVGVANIVRDLFLSVVWPDWLIVMWFA